MNRFVQVGQVVAIREYISGSGSGDTVTIKIRRDIDGYWWNFDHLIFGDTIATGQMTFDAEGVWKSEFTPGQSGSYSVWLTIGESTVFHTLEAVSSPAPASYDGPGLVSEANLESFLEMEIDSTLAATLINSATDFLQRSCVRIFRQATYTNEYLSGEGTPYLYLKQWPVSSITSFTFYNRLTATDTITLVEDRDYYLEPDSGRLVNASGVWDLGTRNYRCTYVAGYATIPEDLKILCMQLCGYWLNRKGVSGIDSQSIGKYSATYSNPMWGELTVDIKAGIQRFSRFIF